VSLRRSYEKAVIVIGYAYLPRLASRLRALWARLSNPRADIRFGHGCYLGPGFSIRAPEGGTFVAGDYSSFRRRFRAELAGPDSQVTIGDGCYFTYDVYFDCQGAIEVGDRVGLAQGNYVGDGGGRLRLADDVQVHSKVTITADLGERVIVGANAAITEPAPPFTVIGGVPARVLDYYGPPGGEPAGWRPEAEAASK
jgi:hypothetical protein